MRSQNALRDDSQDAFAPGKTDEEYEKELSQDDEEQEDKHDDDDDEDEDINNKDGNTDEDEDEDEDDSVEEEEEEEEEAENDDTDPWDKLRGEVLNHLNSTWEEQVEEKVTQGLLKDIADEASNLLLPFTERDYDICICTI